MSIIYTVVIPKIIPITIPIAILLTTTPNTAPSTIPILINIGNFFAVFSWLSVTLQDGKVRKATSKDEYILGIVSETPGILAGTQTSHWHDKYLRDKWNRILYENIVVEEVRDEAGGIIIPKHVISQPMLNPKWDKTREYIPRTKRPEWIPVGLIEEILVRDDGTRKVNEYCKPNDQGVATSSAYGYKVIRRTATDQIMVLFR